MNNTSSYTCLSKLPFLAMLLVTCAAQAQFLPIQLSAEAFNSDIVVERSAPGPVQPATTASMDTGWSNTGYAWYERGFHNNWLATGLPAPGGMITSDLSTDHQYQLAPDYRTNNVALVDSTSSEAELRFAAPVTCAAVSLLLSGMHEGGSGTLNCTLVHADGSEEGSSITCPDWLQRGYSAYCAQGRVQVQDFTFAQVNGGLPQLFTADIPVVNQTNAIVAIRIKQTAGVRTAVFALSAAATPGSSFDPVPVYGYNADMVVEKSATRPQWLSGVTTASMESGENNVLHTWFEQGYVPFDQTLGLPSVGSILTNLNATDHVYAMPSSYTGNCVILVDGRSAEQQVRLQSPAELRAISFLTSSANGPTTNLCIALFTDGSSKTNLWISPDWMTDTNAPAWGARGTVNLDNRFLSLYRCTCPHLFSVDVSLAPAQGAVSNITVKFLGGEPGARTAIVAVSGLVGKVERALLNIRATAAGSLTIETTQPGILESTLDPANPNSWAEEGPITTNRTVPIGSSPRFWRVKQ